MYTKLSDEELKKLANKKKTKIENLSTTDKYYKNLYGNLERTFYAFMINELPQMPDMWDSNNNKRTKSLFKADYTYFIINTMVGVGSSAGSKKGSTDYEKIEKVHIRFALMPMAEDIPEPEIILIYPNYVSKIVGEIDSRKDTESGRRYGLTGRGTGGFTSSNFQLGLTAFFNLFKSSSVSRKITSTLPNEILITNASGSGTHAIWEFHRGEGIQDVGQYNLEIIFRIPLCSDKIQPGNKVQPGKGSYCINWNIQINERKLIDHEYDIKNEKWNIKVNGMKLMDHTDNPKQEVKWNTQIKEFDDIMHREYKDWDLTLLRPINLVKSSEDGDERIKTFSFMQN